MRSLPPAQQVHVDFGRAVFLAAAFYLVARKNKVAVSDPPLLGAAVAGHLCMQEGLLACWMSGIEPRCPSTSTFSFPPSPSTAPTTLLCPRWTV